MKKKFTIHKKDWYCNRDSVFINIQHKSEIKFYKGLKEKRSNCILNKSSYKTLKIYKLLGNFDKRQLKIKVR